MERLSDYLVFCDMDNTLLTAKEGIPACNRSVIQQSPAMVRCCMISRPTVCCVAPA